MIDAEQKENIITDEDNKIWNTISGIGIVIDDDLDVHDEQKGNKEINKIIDILEKQNIPLIEYSGIPNDNELKNLRGISFIILDWKLTDLGEEQKKEGVTVPQESSNDDLNIEFLKKIKKAFLLPVFILTNERVVDIEKILKDAGLVEDNKPRFIFVKEKNSLLRQDELKKCMIEWVKSSSPIKILENLEFSLSQATKKTFSNLYNLSKSWVDILYKQAEDDSVDPIQDITETILRNIKNKIFPLKIKIDKTSEPTTYEEIFSICSERVILKDNIDKQKFDLGYLFYEKNSDNTEYFWINLTPSCDNIIREEEKQDSKKYLVIKGEKKAAIKEEKFKNNSKSKHYIGFISEDIKTIEFDFTEISMKDINELKKFSIIGKLLPPFITDIQVRFSNYLTRQGLPKLPYVVLNGTTTNNKKKDTDNHNKNTKKTNQGFKRRISNFLKNFFTFKNGKKNIIF